MSMKIEGQKCPICHAYLFEEDDIVYCPVCGAPHHRDCYNTVGHCGLQEYHGTENQYDKVRVQKEKEAEQQLKAAEQNEPQFTALVKCKMCGEEFDFNAKSCPKCGAPNVQNTGVQFNFDFLGGTSPDTDMGDGVTADEVKRFVVSNPQRYVPKFAEMKNGKKTSWNWMAFLFPGEWLLSRKMYLYGIVATVISIALSLLQIPFAKTLSELPASDAAGVMGMYQVLAENMSAFNTSSMILMLVCSIGNIIMRIVVGMMGDYWYRGYAISRIKRIKAESSDMDADYRKYGGVSLMAVILGLFARQYLPMIISGFIISM